MTFGVHNLAWQSWFDSHAVSRSARVTEPRTLPSLADSIAWGHAHPSRGFGALLAHASGADDG